MNKPIVLAQLSTSAASRSASPTRVIKLAKPDGGQAHTVQLGYDQNFKIDLSGIANEKITLVHVGEKLIILFDNQSTLTVDPFYDSANAILGNITFDVGGGRLVDGTQFAGIFPITDDQSVLPAAGDQGGPQAGANFRDASVDPLSTPDPLPLLPQEALGNFVIQDQINAQLTQYSKLSFLGLRAIVEEDHLGHSEGGLFPALSDGNEGPTSYNHTTGNTEDFDNDPSTLDGDDDTWQNFDNTTQTFTAQLVVSGGSGIHDFKLVGLPDFNSILKSQGDTIRVHIDPATGVLTGYVDENGGNTFDAGDRAIFTLELTADGKVTFTIYDQLDHDPLNGQPGDNQENNLLVDFSGVILVSDPIAGQSLVLDNIILTVIDDVPVLCPYEKEIHIVDEDDIRTLLSHGTSPNDGNGDGSYTGDSWNNGPGPATVEGSLAHLVKVGADEWPSDREQEPEYGDEVSTFSGPGGGAHFSFKQDGVGLAYLDSLGLSSKGDDLHYDIVGNVLHAYAGDGEGGDRLVFQLTLDINGHYKFELFDQLDHDKPFFGADQNFDLQDDLPYGDVYAIDFGKLIEASDFDGDSIGLDGRLIIKVRDDVPTLVPCDPIQLTVDEDDIKTLGPQLPGESLGTSPNDGNGDGSFTGDPGNNGPGPATVSGHLQGPGGVVVAGADEPLTFSFVYNTESIFLNLGLESKGEALRFDVQGNVLYGYAPNYGGGVVGYDSTDRLVFKFTLNDDGTFKFELFDQIDHDKPASGADENFDLLDGPSSLYSLDFGDVIKATDYDGDSVVLKDMLQIKVRDDVPVLNNSNPIVLTVDEDDVSTIGYTNPTDVNSGSLGTSPNDSNADGSYTGNPANNNPGPAFVSGSLAGLVQSGADENLTFSFISESSLRSYMESLGLKSHGGSLSYDLQSNILYAFDNDGPNQGQTYDVGQDRLVFTLQVNPTTGEFEFKLYDQLDHDVPPSGADQNFDLNDGPSTLNSIDFGHVLKATDYDGDSVVFDGLLKIQVRDDVPVVAQCGPLVLTVDEDDISTLGFTNPTIVNPGSLGTSPNDSNADGSFTGSPANNNPGPAYVSGSLAGLVESGADEELTFSFISETTIRSYMESLGLKSHGGSLSYDLQGNILYAFDNDGPNQGQTYDVGQDRLVFTLELNPATGAFEFKLYDQLDHDAPNSGADQNFDLIDGPSTLTAIDFGHILKATDFDGDSVGLDGMLKIQIRDDIPELSNLHVSGLKVIHDETPGIDGPNDVVSTAQLLALFAGVANKGDDPDVAANPIGFAQSTGSLVSFTAQYGADDGGTTVMSLALSQNGVFSGLKTTEGQNIYLFKEGALVVGRFEVGGDGVPGNDGNTSNEFAAFAIAIDPLTGVVTVVQYMSLDHPNASNPDDSVDLSISNGALYINVKVTDFDGDSVSQNIEVGSKIQFEDDGPTIGQGNRDWTLDEDVLPANAVHPVGNDPYDVPPDFNDYTTINLSSTNLGINWGADGPGTLRFNTSGPNPVINVTDGNGAPVGGSLKSGGVALQYVLVNNADGGQTLTAYKGAPAGGIVVFTMTLDPDFSANGAFSFTLVNELDHPPGDGENTLNLSFGFTAKDGDEDPASSTIVIRIKDDVPHLTVNPTTQVNASAFLALNLDESINSDGDNIKNGGDRYNGVEPHDNNGDLDDVAGVTVPTLSATPLANQAIGHLETSTQTANLGLLFNATWSYGADGPGQVTSSLSFTLSNNGQPVTDTATNLAVTALSGTALESMSLGDRGIYLHQVSATVIEGRVYGADHVSGNGDLVAFRITLNGAANPATATISVDQFLPIDHGGTENPSMFDEVVSLFLTGGGVLGLTETVTITDYDGDQDTKSATVSLIGGENSFIAFDDDGPKPFSVTASNSAVNGLFFDGFTPNNNEWGTGSGTAVGTAGGWTITPSDIGGGVNPQLEKVADNYRGAHSPTGSLMVDMEASPGNVALSQSITLDAGETYRLSFEAGMVDDAAAGSAKLEVWYNGNLITTITPVPGVDLPTYSFDVVGTGAPALLVFKEIGAAGDNTGTYLANITITDIIIIDETEGLQADSDEVADLSAMFAAVSVKGIDPDMPAQYAQGTHSIVANGAIDFGTDGPAATDAKVITLSASAPDVDSGLKTTEGKAIHLFTEGAFVVGRFDADNNGSYETAAFALTVDPVSGVLSLAQFVSLEHPIFPNSYDEGIYLKNGTVLATVTATDGDGDKVSASADVSSLVRFEDDGPAVTSVVKNDVYGPDLIVNGSFEQGHDLPAGQWNIYGSVPGWTTGPDNIPFELQSNGAGGQAPQDGSIIVELDGDTQGNNPPLPPQGAPDPAGHTDATIQQVVNGLVIGQTYELTFYYAPRPGHESSSGMTVSFGGVPVWTSSPDPVDGWQKVTISVVATGTSETLAFTGTGTEDEFGALLDNVSLKADYGHTLDDEDTTLLGVGIQGGPGDDGHGVVASGKINFDAGSDGLKSISVAGFDGLKAIWVDANGVGHQEAVTMVWTPNGQGGTLTGSTTHIATAFTLVVDASGNYTFTLNAPLAHPAPDGAGYENNLQLDFAATITDGDNDTASATICINVDDDTPVAATPGRVAFASVDEDGLNPPTTPLSDSNLDGNPTLRPGEVDDSESNVASGGPGSLKALVNFGADGIGSFGLLATPVAVDSGLNSKGQDVLIFSDGTILRGFVDAGPAGYDVGDRVVFTLVVGADGSYTFTLLDQVDHPDTDNSENLLAGNGIDLSAYVTATDGDGDSVSLGQGTFTIQVRDDIPVVTANPPVLVPETIQYSLDGVSGGNDLYKVLNGTNDYDLLLSGRTGNVPDTVNTSNDIGVGQGQNINGKDNNNDEEYLRIDFVRSGVTSGNNMATTYTAGQHYSVKAFTFSIPQVLQGPATIFLQAFSVPPGEDNASPANFGDNAFVGISSITVNNVVVPVTAVYENDGTTLKGYLISGVGAGAVIGVTGASEFGRLVIGNLDGVVVNIGGSNTLAVDGASSFSVLQGEGTILVPAQFIVRHDETQLPILVNDTPDPNDADDTSAVLPTTLSTRIAGLSLSEIGHAVSAGTVDGLFNYAVGADEDGTKSFVFSTNVANGTFNGVDSGMKTTVGNIVINLFSDPTNPEILWGVAGNTFNSPKVFAAFIDGAGQVWLVQFQAIAHDVDGNTAAAYDDMVSTLAGLLHVTVNFTDADGDTVAQVSNTTVSLQFQDDGPSVVADSDTVVGGQTVATGNVITGIDIPVGFDGNILDGSADKVGTDGAKVTKIVGAISTDTSADGQHNFQATGAHGTLVINENGDYIYTRTGTGPLTATDVFTYTLTDGDGDTAATTLTISIRDLGPTINGIGLTGGDEIVDEDDLADGSSPNAGALTQPGSFTFTAGDGLKDLTIGGQLIVDEGVVQPANFGPFNTTYGQLTILSVDLNTGTVQYSFKLTDNTLAHGPANDGEDFVLESIPVVVTDTDTDSATSNLVIKVIDDVPTASNELLQNVAEGASLPGTFDFVAGADGASVTHVNGIALVFNPGDGNYSQAIDLVDGSIKVKADGTYLFTADNPTNSPVPQIDGTFTVTDSDGDLVTKSFAFQVTDFNHPTSGTATAYVDDDGLTGGNPASILNDRDANLGDLDGALSSEKTYSGILGGSVGGDTPGVYSLAGMNGFGFTLGLEVGTYSWAGNILTANIVGGPRDGLPLFQVEITDPATGAYTVTLLNNVIHQLVADGENVSDDFVSLTYSITDSDLSTVNGALSIVFDDDAPTAINDGNLGSYAEKIAGADLGLASTVLLGNDKFGADGAAATDSLVIGAGDKGGTVSLVAGHLIYSNPTQNVTNGSTVTETFSYTIKDDDGDTSTATFTVTLTDTGVTNLSTSANLIADEDDIPTIGNNDVAAGDDVAVTSGHINYTLGQDNIGSVALSTGATGITKLDGVGSPGTELEFAL